MSEHTPGPWHVSGVRRKWPHAFGSGVMDSHLVETDAEMIAIVPYDQDQHSLCWHDAKLIAAAPDLLAALQRLVLPHFDEHPEDFMPDWHEARAAIRKATGK